MKRMKKVAHALLIVAVIGLIVWGLWGIWHVRTSHRYDESLRLFREAGLPTSLRELAPAPAPPAENAAPLYLEAIDLAKGAPDVRVDSYRTISDDVRQAVESARDLLQLMHDAAKRPRCVFTRDFDDPIHMAPIRVGKLMRPVRLLAARAALRSKGGDLDGALGDLRALFHAARALREEPILLSQIVRLSIDGIGLSALEVVLPRCDSAAEALERIQLDDVKGAVAHGIRGEAGFGATVLCAADDLDPAEVTLARTTPLYWTLQLRAITAPYLKTEATVYLDFFREFFRALKMGYPAAMAEAQRLESELIADAGLLLEALVVRTASLVRREAAIASKLKSARLAARCLDNRRRHGAYPESLGKVASDAEAVDPLTEKPFVLSREDGALCISSPGEASVSWTLPE